jgi:bacillithiol biosynthesis cysteine-adding enzyme BshC
MQFTYETIPLKIKEPSPFFDDYLYNYQKVKSFFEWDFHQELLQCFDTRLQNYQNRNTVVPVIIEQNKKWQGPAASIKNAQLLGHSNTVAVVTGQQAGLFGGPLYTLHKILTIIKVCEKYTEIYPQYHFVPCFWMEVGDSDFQEINHLFIFNNKNELEQISLPNPVEDFRSVYLRNIPDEMEQIFDRLGHTFLNTEFLGETIEIFRKMYKTGRSFADAFASWLLYFFGEYGLVVVHPEDERLKEISKPILWKALENWREIYQQYDIQNRLLNQAGYSSQINLTDSQTMLFIQTEDSTRARIDAETGLYIIQHPLEKQKIPVGDIFHLLDNSPRRFTPNVALRPVLQDFILPTGIYVGGPAEISYAAQLRKIYQYLEVIQPLFFPRIRATIIEKNIQRLISKYEFDYFSLFDLQNKITEKYIQKSTENIFSKEFLILEEELTKSLERLNKVLQEIDPNLISALSKTREQISHALKILLIRANQAFERKIETEMRQINRIQSAIFPSGKFQERQLNIFYFLAKYGLDFINNFKSSVSLDHFEHQLVFV